MGEEEEVGGEGDFTTNWQFVVFGGVCLWCVCVCVCVRARVCVICVCVSAGVHVNVRDNFGRQFSFLYGGFGTGTQACKYLNGKGFLFFCFFTC